MTVTVYRSTDASAPTLTGQIGSLCTVLDAILVNGYGAKAAAGWSLVTSSPIQGKRTYRVGAGNMRAYLRVHDDSQNVFALGREARLRGFETESGFSTDIGAFPLASQAGNGIIFRKSASNDSTTRPWVAIADDRTLYFFALSGDYIGYSSFMFGEYYSFKGGDNFNSIIIGNVTERAVAATTGAITAALPTQETLDTFAAPTAAVAGHFVARSFSEYYQPSFPVGKYGHAGHSAVTSVGLYNYPNNYDNNIHLWPVTIVEPYVNNVIRGRLRGFWHFLHPVGVPIYDGETWSGTGDYNGKTFMAIKPTAQGTGVFVIETSDTWETN
jgi:hypothetical protein